VLLVLSLIVTPMATAGLLTARFTPLLVYWMGFAVWSAWLGLWLAGQSIWLPTAFIATTSVALHLGVRWNSARLIKYDPEQPLGPPSRLIQPLRTLARLGLH
jgi:ABC-type Mn2+/Zn2+ transport system permease subunit